MTTVGAMVEEMRRAGYVVVVFSYEEIAGANPEHLEDALIERGNEMIATWACERGWNYCETCNKWVDERFGDARFAEGDMTCSKCAGVAK